jgi:Holin of 3TMs, for gene-transfer release
MASIVTNLLGGGLLSGISGLINTIRGKSPEDAAKLQELAAKYQDDVLLADQQRAQMQADINKAEASNTSLFVAGWRPAVGWVCAIGLLTQFIIAPLATWGSGLIGKTVTFPSLDMGTLLTLLLGMLGLGGMRTYEKVNSVNSGH